jgi:co-chaperonin GroES (HSP10)
MGIQLVQRGADVIPIKPISDRIICLVERPDVRNRPLIHPSGIQLPDERDDYLILAAGPGKMRHDHTREEMRARPGMRAVFDEWRCQKISWDDMQLAVTSQEDLIGVCDEGGQNFMPLNNLLVCEQLPTERRVGMILLPAIADDRDEATIKMIGGAAPGFAVGDRVLYHKRMGRHFRLHGKELVAFETRFVFCVVDDADIYTKAEVEEA